jgi:hypothetical protein
VRDAHLEANVEFFRRMARREARLDTNPLSPWDHEGFTTPELTDDLVLDSWWFLKKYHLPLTVFMQQPREWIEDMKQCDAMYNTLLDQAFAEAERLKPKPNA